eukprot:scaffold205793_cov30-Tisochrysis_lutea.AAC.1
MFSNGSCASSTKIIIGCEPMLACMCASELATIPQELCCCGFFPRTAANRSSEGRIDSATLADHGCLQECAWLGAECRVTMPVRNDISTRSDCLLMAIAISLAARCFACLEVRRRLRCLDAYLTSLVTRDHSVCVSSRPFSSAEQSATPLTRTAGRCGSAASSGRNSSSGRSGRPKASHSGGISSTNDIDRKEQSILTGMSRLPPTAAHRSTSRAPMPKSLAEDLGPVRPAEGGGCEECGVVVR